ncbi:hypothetical protein COCNU_02G000270 [Cocos nucifera]|uniref:Uncharacterized protein n=1 Tax=Cocos nucifera TaxID=13894 RepID=A0A8K0HY80_COCNU|nr:hypothetical protein COCNU_02G000270 [Cocos nucifera]
MDYGPELQRQRSCAYPVLDVGSWCNGRRRGSGFTRIFANDLEYPSARTTGRRWRGWWRRIIKEKRRILNSASPMHAPYDPYTYAQNFDEGSASVEPENLSRSFSARFAVPSSLLLQRVG